MVQYCMLCVVVPVCMFVCLYIETKTTKTTMYQASYPTKILLNLRFPVKVVHNFDKPLFFDAKLASTLVVALICTKNFII